MGDYWVNFVKTGDPNGPGLPVWPVYLQSDSQIIELGAATTARPLLPAVKFETFRRYVVQGGRIGILN